jgi:hypothetical protein
MLLAVQAWKLRESSRLALAAGEFERALMLARDAQAVQATPIGQFLLAFSAWLENAESS